MYISDFEQFLQEAEDLYKARPLATRYCIKYRHCDSKLVLKVTDDVKCLQFKTDQQQDLKKLERITTMFFALFTNSEAAAEVEPMQVDSQPQQQQLPQQQVQSSKGKKSRRKG